MMRPDDAVIEFDTKMSNVQLGGKNGTQAKVVKVTRLIKLLKMRKINFRLDKEDCIVRPLLSNNCCVCQRKLFD